VQTKAARARSAGPFPVSQMALQRRRNLPGAPRDLWRCPSSPAGELLSGSCYSLEARPALAPSPIDLSSHPCLLHMLGVALRTKPAPPHAAPSARRAMTSFSIVSFAQNSRTFSSLREPAIWAAATTSALRAATALAWLYLPSISPTLA